MFEFGNLSLKEIKKPIKVNLFEESEKRAPYIAAKYGWDFSRRHSNKELKAIMKEIFGETY